MGMECEIGLELKKDQGLRTGYCELRKEVSIDIYGLEGRV